MCHQFPVLTSALELRPQHTPTLFQRAFAYEMSNDIRRAMTDYDDIIARNEAYAESARLHKYLLLQSIDDPSLTANPPVDAHDDESWPGHLWRFVRGEIDGMTLQQSAMTR